MSTSSKEIFYQAIRDGNLEKVKENVKHINKNKKYPLHWGDMSMEKFRNRWWNWLHYSVYFNKIEIVKYLVEIAKIDVNIQTILIVSRSKYYWDDTSLHIAARNGFIPIMQYLLGIEEIKKNIKNYGGKTYTELLPQCLENVEFGDVKDIDLVERVNYLEENFELKLFGGNIIKVNQIFLYLNEDDNEIKKLKKIIAERNKHIEEQETKHQNLLILHKETNMKLEKEILSLKEEIMKLKLMYEQDNGVEGINN